MPNLVGCLSSMPETWVLHDAYIECMKALFSPQDLTNWIKWFTPAMKGGRGKLEGQNYP